MPPEGDAAYRFYAMSRIGGAANRFSAMPPEGDVAEKQKPGSLILVKLDTTSKIISPKNCKKVKPMAPQKQTSLYLPTYNN